jgi:chromosome segregation ATPase
MEEAVRLRQQSEADLILAQQKFEAERNNLKAQIASAQANVVDAMERLNNPARVAAAVREQVEIRLREAKQEWQLQWEGERKRLNAEIDRLRNTGGRAGDERKDAARRAVLERLGKLPAGLGSSSTAMDQLEREYQNAKIQWETEREHLNLKLRKVEVELDRAKNSMRTEIFHEMRSEYEPRLAEANRERSRLEQDLQNASLELATQRERLTARIKQLERALPEAQEAARKQAVAEIQAQSDAKVDEAIRVRARLERKLQEATDEWELERRRLKKQITALEEELKDAREAAFKAQRSAGS